MGVRTFACAAMALLLPAAARAAEVTVKNDSLTDFGNAVVVSGFAGDEKAAAWLTSPCNGNVRATQVFWRSVTGTAPPTFGSAIEIFRAGTFPNPGALQQAIIGPVLNDGVINEYRFLDENNTVPVNVPVTMGETFVVSLAFDTAPPAAGPSVVRDIDGCQANRNTILAEFGTSLVWFSACSLGVAGDWVIRAVVDCPVGAVTADLAIAKTSAASTYVAGGPATYTIAVTNLGPNAAMGASVTDTFPSSEVGVTWSCAATGGAACPVPPTGSGNINALVNVPPGGVVTFSASALVSVGTTGPIVNSAGVFPPAGTTDPVSSNNLSAVTLNLQLDPVFANGFEN